MRTPLTLARALLAISNVVSNYVELLDLRKLVAGKPYSMFYELGKLLEHAGNYGEAQEAYKWAILLAPWEMRSYFKWLSLYRKNREIKP